MPNVLFVFFFTTTSTSLEWLRFYVLPVLHLALCFITICSFMPLYLARRMVSAFVLIAVLLISASSLLVHFKISKMRTCTICGVGVSYK